jgi:hypothetical protein
LLINLKLFRNPFDSKDQVHQVVNVGAALAGLPIMKVEVMWKNLKHALSEGMYQDSANRHHQLLNCIKLTGVTKEIQAMLMNDDGMIQHLRCGGFDSTPNAHYFPRWASDDGYNAGVGLMV